MAKRDAGAPGPHLIARIEELEQEQQRLITERKQRQFQFETMEAHAQKKEHEAKAATKRVEQLEREVSALTKKAEDAAAASTNLEKTLRTKNDTIAYVEQQEAHSKKRLAEVETKLAALQKELDANRLQSQEATKAQGTLSRDLSHMREALALAESISKKKDEEIAQVNREKRSMQTQLEAKEAEIQRSKNEVLSPVHRSHDTTALSITRRL